LKIHRNEGRIQKILDRNFLKHFDWKAMSENQPKATLLLACQSAQSTKLISRHLHDYFNLLSASDAESAWELLLENRDVSLLICELTLANDAFALLERVRDAQDNCLAATPVLLLVGENDSDEQRETAFRSGATDFINLPFASSELKTRVRLHANIYGQHLIEQTIEMQQISAVNVLQQLSQKKFFNSRVQQEISFSLRHRSNMSLCKLRLDNIKTIIAGFDKATAISVVQAVARVVQQTLRREDSLCYLGNAEFLILFPVTNGIGATSGVNRIIKNIANRRIRIAGKQIPVTLSGAIYSCIATDDTSIDQVNLVLDKGIKQAVIDGGNRIVSTLPQSEECVYSIDRALKLIKAGNVDDLSSHASGLLQTVMPLIKFVDQTLQLEMGSILQNFHAQHDQRKK
jgi:two-component system cell cycle response regulator